MQKLDFFCVYNCSPFSISKEMANMLKVCKLDNEKTLKQIKSKLLNGIIMGNSNLIDDIILSMSKEGILDMLDYELKDKRKHNAYIPIKAIMTLSIASKMKIKTSMMDIPYAITDPRVLSRLCYNFNSLDSDKGLFNEGTIRFLIGKYHSEDLYDYYNSIVQNHIMKEKDIKPNIHILDCTKIKVNFDNENYENSSIARDREGNKIRGYKLSCLRGIVGDNGIIEDVRFDTVKIHDLKLSEEMIRTTPCLNEGDILLNDRGFISRELINYLKTVRKVDTYIPLKKNMEAYEIAVEIANEIDDWQPHPTRKNQMICYVNNLGRYWRSDNTTDDVDLNGCVVWFEETQSYAVFITTDMNKSASNIIKTYQLRPEIEEDFRQLKDFWKLEDFKSTKLDVISFHLICVLFGYLFYQLYILSDEGQQYTGKSLPVILKNYRSKQLNDIVLYSKDSFAILSLKDFVLFYDSCDKETKEFIIEFM